MAKFFKLPQYNVFEYKPLYYNPDKEALEEQIERVKRDMGVNDKTKEYRPIIRGHFQRRYNRSKSKAVRRSNIRLLVLVLFLMFISYLLFYT